VPVAQADVVVVHDNTKPVAVRLVGAARLPVETEPAALTFLVNVAHATDAPIPVARPSTPVMMHATSERRTGRITILRERVSAVGDGGSG